MNQEFLLKSSADVRLPQRAADIILKIEKQQESGQRTWPVPRKIGQILHFLIKSTAAKTVLEIGTSVGYSGIFMACALQKTAGHLYTIESHHGRFEEASKNFLAAGVSSQISQIFGHAPLVFIPDSHKQHLRRERSGFLHAQNAYNPIFDNLKFDFVFLDATKKEHINFFQEIQPLLNPSATIITDNMVSHWEEMKAYHDYVVAQPDFESTLIPIETGILLSKKIR